jgi:hypothetical protein
MMTNGFKVGNGLKQGDGLAPHLFNIAMDWQKSNPQYFTKSVQLIGYGDDIHITEKTNRDVSEVYEGLKERVEETWLNIRVEKTKAMVQNRTRKNKQNTEN